MGSIQEFVQTYSPQSEARIVFAWNGKHAAEFADENMVFRQSVCDYFEANKEAIPLPLIAALYNAETLFAKEAWGVNSVVSELAQELLERGGINYIDAYIAGAARGMDAYMESGNIRLSQARCRELLAHCQTCVENGSGSDKNRWGMFVARFSHLLQVSQAQRTP
ncbi:hypothetical protein [Collimonas pratensis]|uniref:hypothetical protein n=1 Tax=Collimonas pratensis TaxID=279113 RepID=UPI0007842656|nr:hypothetical protein [Collimonas pratensis]